MLGSLILIILVSLIVVVAYSNNRKRQTKNTYTRKVSILGLNGAELICSGGFYTHNNMPCIDYIDNMNGQKASFKLWPSVNAPEYFLVCYHNGKHDKTKPLVANYGKAILVHERLSEIGILLTIHIALNDNKIENADLSNENLKHLALLQATISECKFNGADLSNAKICASVISHSDFSNANLENINMTGLSGGTSDLYKAMTGLYSAFNLVFKGTNMRNANFSKAKLGKPDFSNADLTGSDFTDAEVIDSKVSKGTICEDMKIDNLNNGGNDKWLG